MDGLMEIENEAYTEPKEMAGGSEPLDDNFRASETLKIAFKDRKKVSKKYVPEGFESKDDFLKDMREKYNSDVDSDRENRDAALEDKKFAAGDQWDKTVLEHRKGLPNLVINSVPQFTAQLVGDWREDRNAIKVFAEEDSDIDIASIRGDLIRSIEQKSRAPRVYDTGFESMVQCGDGGWRVTVEYANDDVFDQDIFIRPIDDALSIVWDSYSIDPTGRDANHVFVDDAMPKKEYNKAFPGKETTGLGARELSTMANDSWITEDNVRVTEYWRMVERDRLLVLFEDGTILPLESEDYIPDLIEKHGMPVRNRVAPCKYAQMHLVTGFDILDGPYEWKLNRLPIIRCSGRVVNIGGKRMRYGLVRFMKDSVRLKNFWRSVAAEQLGYAPKAKWMATESAVEGREADIRKAHLTRDPLMIFNDEAVFGQNVQQVMPPPIEAALLNEAAANNQDMKDVTGVHDASLGIKSNETSGRAIMARQREGDIASLTFYDNGNASILETGDVINQLIGQVYDGTRTLRLIGEDSEPKMKRVNDPHDPESPDLSIGKYDVATSTGASYTTRRVEGSQAMLEIIQASPDLMSIAGDLVVKAQDWPGAQELAERLKKTIPPELLQEEGEGPQIPPELQQQMEQMQQALQQLQAQNEELQSEKDIKTRETEIKAYEAETGRLKLAADADGKLEQIIAKAVIDALNSPDITPNGSPTVQQSQSAPAGPQVSPQTGGGLSPAPPPETLP
jgi:hypothetical protein